MAGGQERILRRRIRSVESTKKITRAMELIAASRIVRAQHAIVAARPYVERMGEVVANLASSPEAADLPFFQEAEEAGRAAIIFVTADRGLAGAYNSSIIRTVEQLVRRFRAAGRDADLIAIGRKGESFFRHHRYPILSSFTGISDRPSYEEARRIVASVMEPFVAGELQQIELVYTHFRSLGTQTVTTKRLMPFTPDEPGDTGAAEGSPRTVFEFEPEPAGILDRLIPSWLEAQVLAALLESAASEHAARQRAMKAATDNADELIKTLRRVMNRARQDAITTEIMEIVGGAEALRQAGVIAGSGSYHEIFQPAAQTA